MTTFVDSYRFAAGGGGGFSPDDVAGLVLWLDASDAATITHSGGAVSQWDDKSASGLDVVQATGGNKPTTGAATQNGLNVISFDSTDTLAVAPGSPICAAAYSIFTVFRKTGSANAFECAPITMTVSNVASPFDAWDTNRFIDLAAYSGSYTNIKTSTSWAQFSWIGVSGATDTFAERKDGSAVASGTQAQPWSVTSQVITIASRDDGVTKLTGDIAEILIYDVELTGTDLTDVEDYLATKWGTA